MSAEKRWQGVVTITLVCFVVTVACQAWTQTEEAALPTLVPTAVLATQPAPAGDGAGSGLPATNTPVPTTISSVPPTFTPQPDQPASAADSDQPAVESVPTVGDAGASASVPANALQIVTEAEANLRQLRSFNHMRAVKVDSTSFQLTENLDCAMRPPDQIYCHVYRRSANMGEAPAVEDFEFVQRGQRVWLRNSSSAPWTELAQDGGSGVNYLEVQTSQLQPSPFTMDASITGETTIEGLPTDEITLALDPETAVQRLFDADTFNALQEETKDVHAVMTLWVDREQRLMRKVRIRVSFFVQDSSVQVTGEGTLYNFNQPVEIPDPAG